MAARTWVPKVMMVKSRSILRWRQDIPGRRDCCWRGSPRGLSPNENKRGQVCTRPLHLQPTLRTIERVGYLLFYFLTATYYPCIVAADKLVIKPGIRFSEVGT